MRASRHEEILSDVNLAGAKVPDSLGQCALIHMGAGGRPEAAQLGDLWSKGPALVVFLRHLACPGCSEELSLLAPRLSELGDLGVRVGLVTSAEPERLPAFSERMRLDGGHAELFSDVALQAYRAAGFERSSWATYGPRSVALSLKLYALGHGAPRSPGDGDVTQQGGALLVDGAGRVILHHLAADLADHLSIDAVMDAVLALAAARAEQWA